MNKIEQLLEEQESLGISKSGSEHDAVEPPGLEAARNFRFGSVSRIHQTTGDVVSSIAKLAKLRVDEIPEELRRKVRKLREIGKGGV